MKMKVLAIVLIVMMMVGFIPSAKADDEDSSDLITEVEPGENFDSESHNEAIVSGNVKSISPVIANEVKTAAGSCMIKTHSFYKIAKKDFIDDFPKEFYEVCPEQGNVEVVYAKNKDGKRCGDPICVYTPAGYENDSDEKCNVVFLVSGSGGNMNNWLNDDFGGMNGSKLFDWLIYSGRVDPFIAVSVNLPSADGYHYTSSNYQELATKIENYYLPYVVENYNTYAETSDVEDIASQSNHFMIAGLSQGAICLSNIALDANSYIGKCFGNVTLMSNYVYGDTISKKVGDSNRNMFFVDGGKADSNRGGSPHDITKGYKRYDNLKDAKYFEYDSGHTWRTWFRGIAATLECSMK